MQDNHKSFTESKDKDAENKGNKSFEKSYKEDATIGAGYSEAERDLHSDTDSRKPAEPEDNGSQELVERYNINDKAYSDSSKDDFVKTVSKFHHADQADDDKNNTDE